MGAEQDARVSWDNPVQRVLYLAMSMTKATSRLNCPTYEVTAYTFFGAEVDHVFVNCTGIRR